MKSSAYICCLLFTALVVNSCQKELMPDFFVIGNESGISVKTLQNQVSHSCYGQEDVISVDLNDDGEFDLKFYTYAMDSLGDQDKRGSSVWALDTKIEFGYKIKYEELFSVTDNTDQGQREIIYNERSHFYCPTCQNLSQNKDRFTFSSPVVLSVGSSLSKDIKWSDKLQILSQFDQSRQFSKEENNIPVYNNIMTGLWDENGEGYLPFRIKRSFSRYQYGWIKIMVSDHRQIELFEIGIQNDR